MALMDNCRLSYNDGQSLYNIIQQALLLNN